MNKAVFLSCAILSGCVYETVSFDLPPPIEVHAPARLACDSTTQSDEYPDCEPADCECSDGLDFCEAAAHDGAMCCLDALDFVVVGVCRYGFCDWDTCYAPGPEPAGPCEAHDVFVGSDGCYQPSPGCCPDAPGALDACGGAEALYLCSGMPANLDGGPTDFRACHVPDMAPVGCAWGASTPLCCEP